MHAEDHEHREGGSRRGSPPGGLRLSGCRSLAAPPDPEERLIVTLRSQLPGPPVCVRMLLFVFPEVPTSEGRNCSGTHLLTCGGTASPNPRIPESPSCWRAAGPQETRSHQNLCPGTKGCPHGLAGVKAAGRQAWRPGGPRGGPRLTPKGPLARVPVGSPHRDLGFQPTREDQGKEVGQHWEGFASTENPVAAGPQGAAALFSALDARSKDRLGQEQAGI